MSYFLLGLIIGFYAGATLIALLTVNNKGDK